MIIGISSALDPKGSLPLDLVDDLVASTDDVQRGHLAASRMELSCLGRVFADRLSCG